ncbi:ABC transporter permease subunit [Streptomyces sp. NPDC001508]|uniref:ABC transporter permease subunit n=1 Tax=Streptomyces sp. NPDC001508 TaxID=3154656 RepID=UPI0033169A32
MSEPRSGRHRLPRRRAVLTAAAVGLSTALTAALTACSTASVGTTSEGITLTFSWWGNNDRAARTERAVRLFEKEHPGVTVRTSNGEFGSYLQKLATQAAGRSAFYAPSLLGAGMSVALVWRALFNDGGSVPDVLGTFGIHTGSWVGNPSLAVYAVALLTVWQFGAPMVIFLAGLQQVPPDLYEAAALDGAGRRRQFVSITVPMLSPVVFFNLVLEIINSFQVFTPAFAISGGDGGPADSTMFYTLYLYERGFTASHMGYAAAMAWLLLIAIGVITLILFRTSRSWVFYADEETR